MEAVADLAAAVEAGYFDGVANLLNQMSASELDEAGRWYRRKGRARARRLTIESFSRSSEDARSIQLLLALSLAQTPQEAATNCQFGRSWWILTAAAAPGCGQALIQRGRDWVVEFVDLATNARLRHGEGDERELVALISAAIAAFGLSTPLTETYTTGWVGLISSAHVGAKHPDRSWQPLTLMTVQSTRGPHAVDATPEPAYRVNAELTLLDCLAASPAVTDLLVTGLGVANLFKDWGGFTEEGWQVAPAIAAGVASGVLERQPLMDAAFAALSRDDKAGNQRVVAEMLRGLAPTPAEVRERVATIVHVMPTVHGSVTRLLLEMALSSELEEGDLIDIGTVILARPEKAQKVTLLDHLAATSSNAAREALLSLASTSEDAALAGRARELLGDDAPPLEGDESNTAGLPHWAQHVEPYQSEPFAPYAPSEAGFDQARSDQDSWSAITQEAAHLDMVVRFGHRDLAGLRAQARPTSEYSSLRTPFLLYQWAQTGDPRRSYTYITTSAQLTPDGWVQTEHQNEHRPPPPLLFTDRLVAETLSRLGDLAELLSTPTHRDGTLAVAALAQRVKAAADFGPYDLVQALFRLGATDPSDVTLFDAVTLSPVGGSSVSDHDAAQAIRQWISAGGWQARRVAFPDAEPATSSLDLPLPAWLAELPGVAELTGPSPDRTDYSWFGVTASGCLSVSAWDVEHVATLMALAQEHRDSVAYAEQLPVMAGSAGPIGPAVHHHLARLLSHPSLDSRLLAARYAGWFAGQGRLDPELFRARNLALFEAGELSVARAAHGWSQLAMNASLSVVWPSWVALLDAACAAVKKPAGLADLLRATREFAPVVSAELGDWVPDSVRQLAQGKGKTKAVIEAAALVSSVSAVA